MWPGSRKRDLTYIVYHVRPDYAVYPFLSLSLSRSRSVHVHSAPYEQVCEQANGRVERWSAHIRRSHLYRARLWAWKGTASRTTTLYRTTATTVAAAAAAAAALIQSRPSWPPRYYTCIRTHIYWHIQRNTRARYWYRQQHGVRGIESGPIAVCAYGHGDGAVHLAATRHTPPYLHCIPCQGISTIFRWVRCNFSASGYRAWEPTTGIYYIKVKRKKGESRSCRVHGVSRIHERHEGLAMATTELCALPSFACPPCLPSAS